MKQKLTAFAIYLCATLACAQTLQPVVAPTGTNWLLVAGIAVVVIVAGYVYLKHKDPAAAAKVNSDASSFYTAALAEFQKMRAAMEKTATATAAAAPAVVVTEATPATPAGKNGVAGTFSIAVTGNPATDIAAINAAYFA